MVLWVVARVVATVSGMVARADAMVVTDEEDLPKVECSPFPL